MYQALLTRRYLRSRVMPLLAAVAVVLCTSMVLVVWSVMGGFLNLLLDSGKSMIGDVSIASDIRGIARYEVLIEDLQRDPMVEAATPVIETLGLVTIPAVGITKPVQVIGIEPASYDKVTGFFDRLWWQPLDKPLPKDRKREDPRLKHAEVMARIFEEGKTLSHTDPSTLAELPGIVPGVELIGGNAERRPEGFLEPRVVFMPGQELTVQVMPISERGVPISPAAKSLTVTNEFRTGLYQADAEWVIVPLDVLQKMLMLDEAQRVEGTDGFGVDRDDQGNESFTRPVVTRTEPARVTTIMVKGAGGITPDVLVERTKEIYAQFHEQQRSAGQFTPSPASIQINTWESKPGIKMFISAVKKETALVLVLFAFISLTAVFLVFAIFWSMISEKVKDIGILRALGASRLGVAWLFLRYGLAIGILGSIGGGVIAYIIVSNINPIHEWLGRAMGIVVWDPKVYYFTEIPNHVEPTKAAIVLSFGVLASALGALAPALRAAHMDPVKALRFE